MGNWCRYLVGRHIPSTIKILNKKKLSIAYKLGYGDYVWCRMNRGYIDSKGFRFKGIPLEDRIKDRSVYLSDFFAGDARFRNQ